MYMGTRNSGPLHYLEIPASEGNPSFPDKRDFAKISVCRKIPVSREIQFYFPNPRNGNWFGYANFLDIPNTVYTPYVLCSIYIIFFWMIYWYSIYKGSIHIVTLHEKNIEKRFLFSSIFQWWRLFTIFRFISYVTGKFNENSNVLGEMWWHGDMAQCKKERSNNFLKKKIICIHVALDTKHGYNTGNVNYFRILAECVGWCWSMPMY